MLLLLATVTMMYGKEPGGVLHTIITKTSSIFRTSITIRIRSEGTKRIVRVPVYSTETVEVGYKANDGNFYKKDGSIWDELQQYYNYVDTQNTYIESENGIIELEDVGYYEGEVITKERTTKTGSYEDVELSPNADKNIIVISGNGSIKKILSFKDKYSIGEVSQETLNNWIEWLKSNNKTENELFSKLSQRVYITINSENPYQGLYEEGGEYLRKYFNISYENKEYNNSISERLKTKGEDIVNQNVSYRDSDKMIKSLFGTKGNDNKGIIEEALGIENDYDSLLEKGEIVPNLQEVKPGDIVAFKENGKPETGIVINTTDKIEIAYIDATVGRAVTYNFEKIKTKADAEAFVVIRILGEEKQDIKNANWNVLEDKVNDVKINIETMKESSQKSNEKHRWIPNTGEYLELSDIRVTIKTEMGIELVKKDIPIGLVGAVDRGYLENPTSGDYGNIYKNKATRFEVIIRTQIPSITEHNCDILQKTEEKEIYNLYEDPDTNGLDNKFNIDEDGYVVDESGQKVTIQIRPVAEQIYPGDDLLLLFKIGETEYTVDPEDYIAVYDKKMLWRANQYISETEARLQNLDWNNAHPWNTNDSTVGWYGTNDWLGDTNGGQIPIQGWTRFNDDEDVNGSVAYGWGCFDSIIAFNDELRKQSEAITKYKEENNKKADKKYKINWEESDLGVYAPTREKVEEKTETSNTTSSQSQEEKVWENYIFPNVSFVLEVEPKKLKDREETDLFISTETSLSVPGLSTYWYDEDAYIAGTHEKNTSGVDCSGLAFISTLYMDNKYKTNQFITKIGETITIDKPNTTNFAGGESAWINRKTVKIDPLSMPIFAASDDNPWDITINEEELKINLDDLEDEEKDRIIKELLKKRDNQRKLLSYAVPGDVLVKGGDHVVIIQDLQYEGDNTVITDYSQVYVIHATQGGKSSPEQWNVQKGNWNELGDTKKLSYQLRRLEKEK